MKMAVLGLFEGHFITPFFQKNHIGSNGPCRLSRPLSSSLCWRFCIDDLRLTRKLIFYKYQHNSADHA